MKIYKSYLACLFFNVSMSNPWCARAILAAYLAWSRSWILEKVGSRWSLKLQPPRTEERTGARTRTGASIAGVVPSNISAGDPLHKCTAAERWR